MGSEWIWFSFAPSEFDGIKSTLTLIPLRWLAVDAVAPVVGASLSLLITPSAGVLSILLAVFCGFFLHIGASGLLPESHRAYPRSSTTVATLLGAGFLYAVTALVR